MMRSSQVPDVEHIGLHVRGNILPAEMTVKEAAKLIGVSRPTFSKLLNGRARLSRNMAVRLERVFGADSQGLLDLQAQFDLRPEGSEEEPVVTGTYAPSITTIRAGQLDQWANDIETRSRLAVLVRMLVRSTGILTRPADFPGYDNAERHGWDGYVEAAEPTQWVPRGVSVWEMGTSANPRRKADDDYRNSLESMPSEERAECAFVFVTPRNWSGRKNWEDEKNRLGHWKGVRAYDASDLEQWIEQSAPVQVWMAEELGDPVTGYRSLDECWRRWSNVTEPSLLPSLFKSATAEHALKLETWLDGPPASPFVIAADSNEEALAFLSALVDASESQSGSWGNRTIVFYTPASFQKLARSLPPNLVAVASNMDVEREMAHVDREVHCIFVRPRGLIDSEPDIVLDRLNRNDFRSALEDMSMSQDQIDGLVRESARSPTILRRRLSKSDVIRVPVWARSKEHARRLAPVALIGTWVDNSPADQQVMKDLARTDDHENIETDIISLLQLEDSPVWRVGHHRGVVSKLDALFAISKWIPGELLTRFFKVAKEILSDPDPSLELPIEQQWMAPVYDKVRNHSSALRAGILETLVIFAVHGDDLPGLRESGMQARVDALVGELMGEPGDAVLLSLHNDLPELAEAAPDVFLETIERDLRSDDPATLRLFASGGEPLFSVQRHTGLLWALELLAWNAEYLPRVARILAKLCDLSVPNNLGNTPMASLGFMFRCWMPQTAATLEQRIKTLEVIARQYPEIGWRLCIQQIVPRRDVVWPNRRPRWRSDAFDAGHGVDDSEIKQFIEAAVDIALSWERHDERTLGDLVGRADHWDLNEKRETLWGLIEEWADHTASDESRSKLWDRLRLSASEAGNREPRMQAVIEKLQPANVVMRHKWMFSRECVDYPEVSRQQDDDYEAVEIRIAKLRLDALREIWDRNGNEGVKLLIEQSEEAPFLVGRVMPQILTEVAPLADYAQACVEASGGDQQSSYASCLRVVLNYSAAADMGQLVASLEPDLSVDDLLILFLCMPLRRLTWDLLDTADGTLRERYWTQVTVPLFGPAPSELNELIDNLLEVKRPLEAFNAVDWYWDSIETSRLKRLLFALPSDESNEPIDSTRLSSALDALDKRPEVSVEDKASLEFIYVSGLSDSRHGIPNLESLIAATPSLFVELIEAVYGHTPDPDSQDREDLLVQSRGTAAYFTLQRIRRTPGSDEAGNINLEKLKSWLTEVRDLCDNADFSRACDSMIGQILSRARTESDDVWPCTPVCEALEWMSSESVREGFIIGAFNSRGAMFRGRGGEQERKLAEQYRTHAQKISYEYPFTSSILKRMADNYDREARWWDERTEVTERLHD